MLAENSDPDAVRKRAMADPEVQQILQDPAMNMILQQMTKDPDAVREWVFYTSSLHWVLVSWTTIKWTSSVNVFSQNQ